MYRFLKENPNLAKQEARWILILCALACRVNSKSEARLIM
jgi:hypothetical protein